jgi:hypothetical protein
MVYLSGMRALLATLALIATLLPAAAAELVMFERPGCVWCERFDREVAPKWPASAEGRRAPLRRVDLTRTLPPDLAGLAPVRFTPTFVLVVGGAEIGRVTGYPGEDFFWGLAANLIRRLPAGP